MNKEDLKVVITPEDVYGPGWEEDIPNGWEVARFGIAESDGALLARPVRDRELPHRIILRRSKRKKIVFTFVGRVAPCPGQWFLSDDAESFLLVREGDSYTLPRDVYTKEEIEE